MTTSLETPEKLRKLQTGLFTKAKKEPAFRFYLLYDKVYRPDVLEHAWKLVRENRGAPGVDGQTIGDVESAGVSEWLASLGKELREETYEPSAVRRVMIPKANGGERPLGIPTVRDRVVQTAAKLVLEPIFEADFDESAYGYRPGRGARDAAARVNELLRAGYTDVVDADLSRYFDTIPHDALMKSIARRVSDRRMLSLIRSWLKVPVEEGDGRGGRRWTGGKGSRMGTPQGGSISPLLANIYIHRLLRHFKRSGQCERLSAHIVNYADDFVILSRRRAHEALAWTRRTVEKIGLTLNEEKTVVRDAWKESFDFLGFTFGGLWSIRKSCRYLGATPSRKSLKRARAAIRDRLRPGNQQPLDAVVGALNRYLIGWENYFDFGSPSNAFWKLNDYAADRLRAFLVRRHKVPTRGTRRFPGEQIYGEIGLHRLRATRVAASS